VSIAAFFVSIIAVLIALGSLVYVRRADRRANRAEHRTEAAERVARLERVGEIMRDIAAAVRGSATDPHSSSRIHAGRARLEEAIAAADVDLPACSEYARTVDPGSLAPAERELERAIAAVTSG
jgi:hypothetical protein